ncbi:hypothetical protein MHYP_G00303830 [Metynnis hypsauchen]
MSSSGFSLGEKENVQTCNSTPACNCTKFSPESRPISNEERRADPHLLNIRICAEGVKQYQHPVGSIL